MKRLFVLGIALLAFGLLALPTVDAALTGRIVGRYDVRDGLWERVKIAVRLDDGSVREYWPYVQKGTATDRQLVERAVAVVQAQLDAEAEAAANLPIERREANAVVLRLRALGKITSTTWDAMKSEIGFSAVGP